MGMTIGQGMILGAQGYLEEKERIRRNQWEDEERARQRKAWTARDTTMTQLSNADKEQVVGDVPAENWQDPPVAQRRAAIEPQQLYEKQQRILSTSEDPALMTQGIGMYPQVEQGKELAYQRGMRDKRNAAAKQYSDMLSAINEGRLGVHSGELHPAVAMKALGSFQTANLAVAGMTGQERWSFIDDKGKAQFRPITKADVLKLLDEAEGNVRKMYDDAVMGLSAEDADKVIGRRQEDRKIGATETSAAAAMRNAASAEQKVGLEASLLEDQRGVLRAHAGYYDAAAGNQRAAAGAANTSRQAEADIKEAILRAEKDYQVASGILITGKTPDGQPLTPEARANYEMERRRAGERMLYLRGRDPKEDGNVDAYQKAIGAYVNANGRMPDENTLLAMKQEFGIPVSDPIMDAIRKAGGLSGAKPAEKPREAAIAPPKKVEVKKEPTYRGSQGLTQKPEVRRGYQTGQ
jgi:hypothetical protein